jgi:hypothetical protein
VRPEGPGKRHKNFRGKTIKERKEDQLGIRGQEGG